MIGRSVTLQTCLLSALVVGLGGQSAAQELTSENFRLLGPTLSGGGGVDLQSASGNTRALGTTIGQSSPLGVMTGPSGTTLESGFWPIVAGTLPVEDDTDGDGTPDSQDNCIEQSNPDQNDTDQDGFGNLCDCDFDQDEICSIADFTEFLADFTVQTDGGTGTDMDGNGLVGVGDFTLFLSRFQEGLPGPSGLVP